MTNREWAISESGIYSPYDHNESRYIQELEDNIEKIEKEKDEVRYKLEEMEDDLKFFIKSFIDLGNSEQDLNEAFARLFEIYKEYGYEKYYKENK